MTTARRSLSGIHSTCTIMKISLRRALWLAVGPANVDAAGHAVADWFDGFNCSGAADVIREALRDQPDQPAPAVPHSRPDTSLRAELLQKLATHREVLLSLCDRVDRLEARADGLTPIERVERHWAKERSVKESLTVGGDRLAVPEDREPVALVGEPTDAELGSLWAGAAHIDQEHGGVKFARAVLARWGHQPAPPAEGEVAELSNLKDRALKALQFVDEKLDLPLHNHCNAIHAIRTALDRLAPQPEPPAEALAARPLLEKVARLGDVIGQQTVAQVQQLAEQAAFWLRENPPGQPVAIEPRGCPTPGACTCVEPTLPLPAGEGEE